MFGPAAIVFHSASVYANVYLGTEFSGQAFLQAPHFMWLVSLKTHFYSNRQALRFFGALGDGMVDVPC